MDKKEVRQKVFRFLGTVDKKIKTKFSNISGKTGQYNVPDELFQKRTARKNRVLISWKTVKQNNLTIDQLASFAGGVVVEFVNEDFFDKANESNPIFIELKNRLGGDDVVSSIISIRSESGSSSSATQRTAFKNLKNNTKVIYKGEEVVLTPNNYSDYFIKKTKKSNTGNDKWEGFIFLSIRGGQQDIELSHNKNITLFNPACEYANEVVSQDLDCVMAYFAMLSIGQASRTTEYEKLLKDLEGVLESTVYNSDSYKGNLLEYCKNHPSAQMSKGELYDPIQVEPIHIEDFAVDNKEDARNLDFTHDEAVNKDRYYWDVEKQCILTPARPTNVFWSKHLSNMMQQNFSLKEYFAHEESIIAKRKKLLGDN